jgi:hypothetical protein
LNARPGMTVSLLGVDAPLSWKQETEGITIFFPHLLSVTPALTLKIAPQPDPLA